ncbi:hypothetical protein ABFS82_13G099200 [Erythranthe guttata]
MVFIFPKFNLFPPPPKSKCKHQKSISIFLLHIYASIHSPFPPSLSITLYLTHTHTHHNTHTYIKMALFNNGGKENNTPICSSNKKRKLRIPLEDITNLMYPGCAPSLQETPISLTSRSVFEPQFLLAGSVYQVNKRFKRADDTSNSRLDSSIAAAASARLRKHFR